ncbi:hypothetical protein V6N12_003215 [Hibiscus sabdariffa]|uniref:Uncharacterized protein n=1 Tax=Hibiscus sabdariffa TaxID=183260 RepID=A0ABR2EB90_9ROSI
MRGTAKLPLQKGGGGTLSFPDGRWLPTKQVFGLLLFSASPRLVSVTLDLLSRFFTIFLVLLWPIGGANFGSKNHA